MSYIAYNDHVEITGCNESATTVVIPEEIENLPVTKNVEYIGSLDGTTALEEIVVDEENPVYYSYDGALYKYKFKRGWYNEKTYNALIVCPMGKQGECTVKDGTEYIFEIAFEGCAEITSINIPESVTYIGKFFCNDCTSLTDINVDEKNPIYYSYDGLLYGYNYEYSVYYEDTDSNEWRTGSVVLVCPQGKTGNITIKDRTRVIGAYAFENISEMTSVTIPDSVEFIVEGRTASTISNGYEQGEYYWDRIYYFNGKIYGKKGSLAKWYADLYDYKFVIKK